MEELIVLPRRGRVSRGRGFGGERKTGGVE